MLNFSYLNNGMQNFNYDHQWNPFVCPIKNLRRISIELWYTKGYIRGHAWVAFLTMILLLITYPLFSREL